MIENVFPKLNSMKKYIFLTAIIAVISVANLAAQGFHVGAKLGGNAVKISGQSFNDGFNLGYQLGGFAEINFSKTIGIQPEVLFSQSQTTTTTFNSNLSPNKDAKLNYLSIPILLNINASKLLTFQVGPEYSILVNNDNTFVQNSKNAFKSGDFSMVGGIQLNLNPIKIYGRYNIGLSNLKNNGKARQYKWVLVYASSKKIFKLN